MQRNLLDREESMMLEAETAEQNAKRAVRRNEARTSSIVQELRDELRIVHKQMAVERERKRRPPKVGTMKRKRKQELCLWGVPCERVGTQSP